MISIDWWYIILGIFAIFLIIQTHLKSNSLITYCAIATIIYFIINKFKINVSKYSILDSKLKQIRHDTTNAYGQMYVKNDLTLTNFLIDLSKYAALDTACFNEIVEKTYMFFDLYCQLMLQKKNMHAHFVSLFTLRKNIINLLYSFYMKTDKLDNDALFENMIKLMIKVTKSSITKLRNKFNHNDLYEPIPSNIYMTDSTIDFF